MFLNIFIDSANVYRAETYFPFYLKITPLIKHVLAYIYAKCSYNSFS